MCITKTNFHTIIQTYLHHGFSSFFLFGTALPHQRSEVDGHQTVGLYFTRHCVGAKLNSDLNSTSQIYIVRNTFLKME